MISGPLNISAPRDFGLTYLSPAILSFSKRYPEIQMKVDFDDRAVDLNRENYDFAIRITAKVEDAVVAQKIGCAQLRLCASPFYLKRKEEPKHLNDLINHRLLHFGKAR